MEIGLAHGPMQLPPKSVFSCFTRLEGERKKEGGYFKDT